MNRVRHTERIDSYVELEMDEVAMKQFESELISNKQLLFEYKLEQDISKALLQEDILDFRSKCLVAQNEVKLSVSKLGKVVQITRKYWYAAASLVLIALIAGSFLLLNPGTYSPEKLFKMYYKSGETIGLSRSGNVDMAEALRYFSRNEFQTAENLFDEILVNDPSNFAVQYYSGISNIELKNFPKAITMFESIIDDGTSLYTENAEWYLGLTYLADNKMDQANTIFLRIASMPDHYYFEEAKSILGKIKESGKSKKFLNNLLFLILPF